MKNTQEKKKKNQNPTVSLHEDLWGKNLAVSY